METFQPRSPSSCARCGIEYAPPAKFCSECGSSLRGETPKVVAGMGAAERRHITTMFCDLIGSTSLSLRLDPEEYSYLIKAYREICSRCINNGGGAINKFMGDGILACFGYPRSHEDDAVRACRVGLQIIGAMHEALPSLDVRIAAATGLVVSNDMNDDRAVEQHSIIGATPNLAARLQERAPPGGMLIADETRALVGDWFEFEDAGLHDLKGVGHPVRAWQIVGERNVESRFAARSRETAASLVGRQRERRNFCWIAGTLHAPARVNSSCCMVNRESASRASYTNCAGTWRETGTRPWSSSVQRIIRPAHSIP